MSLGARTVTLAGWVGKDAEWREVNGQGVLNVNLGLDASWQAADGTWNNKTVWYKVTRWYKNPAHAQQLSEKIKKFDKLVVIGDLEDPEVWIGKDGKAAGQNRLTAHKIQVVRPDARGEAQPPQQAPLDEIHDEDIPF